MRGQTKVKDKVGQPKVKIQERKAKGGNAKEPSQMKKCKRGQKRSNCKIG